MYYAVNRTLGLGVQISAFLNICEFWVVLNHIDHIFAVLSNSPLNCSSSQTSLFMFGMTVQFK